MKLGSELDTAVDANHDADDEHKFERRQENGAENYVVEIIQQEYNTVEFEGQVWDRFGNASSQESH